MKLGDYTFPWVPDKFTIPKSEKFNSHVLTYSGVAYFSWGVSIVGKVIELEWEWMSAEQFLELQELVKDDEQKVWDLEAPARIWYENAVNHPFVTEKHVESDSGAEADISAVDTIYNNITVTDIEGSFVAGESFHDDSIPQKTGTISVLEIHPDYNVEILNLEGEYFENMQTYFVFRKNVKLVLLIMSEVS